MIVLLKKVCQLIGRSAANLVPRPSVHDAPAAPFLERRYS